jgi:hypothetical protein
MEVVTGWLRYLYLALSLSFGRHLDRIDLIEIAVLDQAKYCRFIKT